MDPRTTDQQGLDYLLGVANAVSTGLAIPTVPSPNLRDALAPIEVADGGASAAAASTHSGVGLDHTHDNITNTSSGAVTPDAVSSGAANVLDGLDGDVGGGTASASGGGEGDGSGGGGVGGANPKKRPLDDKKDRERKRVMRNRQLARVSNERRKGRIKAMESELTETRQTVTTLEDSISCLEEENRELRKLLQGKPDNVPISAAQLPQDVGAGAGGGLHHHLQQQPATVVAAATVALPVNVQQVPQGLQAAVASRGRIA